MHKIFFLSVLLSVNSLAVCEGVVPFAISTSFAIAGTVLGGFASFKSHQVQVEEDKLVPTGVLLVVSATFLLFAGAAGLDHFINPARFGPIPTGVLAILATLSAAAAVGNSIYVFTEKNKEKLKDSFALTIATLAANIGYLVGYGYILCETRRLSRVFVFPVYPEPIQVIAGPRHHQ